jgi:hypothetical protein
MLSKNGELLPVPGVEKQSVVNINILERENPDLAK